jgi:hypothetical protein
MRWFRKIASLSVFVLLFLLIAPVSVQAETVNDAGAWVGVFTRGDIDNDSTDGLKWWFDGHARFFDDSGGFGQSLVRPGIGYALTESATAWIGYGWIRTSPDSNADFDEHRIWQQLTWSKSIDSVTLGFRTRLEQRFLETGSDTGWRIRQLLSLRKPFQCAPRHTFVVWDELFVHLNDTDWGARNGFDQNRLFIGFGWKRCHSSNWRVEIGYLNQFIDQTGRDDTSNHLVSINFYGRP